MISSACEEMTTSSSVIPSSISISASASSSSSSALHHSLHGPNPYANQDLIDRPPMKKKRNLPGNPGKFNLIVTGHMCAAAGEFD